MRTFFIVLFLLLCSVCVRAQNSLEGYYETKCDWNPELGTVLTLYVRVDDEGQEEPEIWKRYPRSIAIKEIFSGGWKLYGKEPEYIIYYCRYADMPYNEYALKLAYNYLQKNPRANKYEHKDFIVLFKKVK